MKKTDDTKTLSVRREALKELSQVDLRHVAGGPGGGGNGGTWLA